MHNERQPSGRDQRLRYPDFFVVGVVKGGTTALHTLLSDHPGIHLSPIKETNFFSRADMRPEHFVREYALDVRMDVKRYIAQGMKEVVHIAHVDDANDYLRLFGKARTRHKLGEVCPSYAICPSAAGAIHAAVPGARIFIMLRDPVLRAWSHYLMNVREGKTRNASFLDEVMADDARSPKGWGINHQYLALGEYDVQVKRYLDLFPKERVHVLLYEHFKADPNATLKSMFADIGVMQDVAIDTDRQSNAAAVPRNAALNAMLVKSGALKVVKDLVPRGMRGNFKKMLYSRKGMPRLPHDEALKLWAHYAPGVERLKDLTGINVLQAWGPEHYGNG
ncbi:MAG: sulfotransferase [Flavobacteriales bacterium]